MRIQPALLTTALLACLSLPAQAELIFSTPPAQDKADTTALFTELASQLAEILDEPVRYVAPAYGMSDYGKHVRKGDYDILLDGPQFAAWRIAKGMHKPVAQSDTQLSFLVVVPTTDTKTNSPEQLVNKTVCLQPSPNLSNLMFMSLYRDPFQLPDVRMVEGFKPIVDKVIEGTCSAGVIPAALYDKTLDKDTQNKLRIVYNTRPLPGLTLTVSNKVSDAKREDLTKRLTNADPATDKLVQTLTAAGGRGGVPTKTRWQAINPESLKGLDQILVQQAYGWD